MDDLTARLARIDSLIARHHDAYLAAVWHGLPAEALIHSHAVDRLLTLRYRVQRGTLTATKSSP